MKIKSFVTILTAVAIFGCGKTTTKKQEFLLLNPSQIKTLGINVTDQGVFYKNTNPSWQQDNEKYATLAFNLCDDNYVSSMHLKENDTIVVKSKNDSILKLTETSKNDFYPLLIGNTKGEFSLDASPSNEIKMLPIAICMADTKLPNRKDTVVVWFKVTESLKKLLPQNINIDEYLKTKPTEKK